jgi:hypothetical protein
MKLLNPSQIMTRRKALAAAAAGGVGVLSTAVFGKMLTESAVRQLEKPADQRNIASIAPKPFVLTF